MSESSGIIAAARSPGPFFAFAETGGPATFAWGAGGSGNFQVRSQKFYFPRDRQGELWTGFSRSSLLSLANFASLERLPLIAPAFKFPDPVTEEKGTWENYCRKIDGEISSGRLHKAVPARFRSFALSPGERAPLLDSIFARLFAPSAARTFRFLFRENQDVFFGATPELLFRREKGELFVPAIAGTRSLAHGTESEASLALMDSPKEREEHNLVVEGILNSLRKLGLKPKAPPQPDILRVPGLLHLYTPISASDNPGISSEQLIGALHPTPAVGGLPKEAAHDFLFAEEPWDRGLFASPLLFRGPGRELCLVAIRSALLRSDSLHLFAGAGFVRASDAESEHAETNRKMDVMQSLLSGGEI